MSPRITVVVVTYHSRDFIDACLSSLRHQTLHPHAYEVVVVDNASTDGTAERVAEAHPWVRLVRSAQNLGFGGGCELGRRHAPSDFVVLVNSDARVAPDFVERIVAPLQRDPEVAAVTGHVVLEPRFVADPLAGDVRTRDGRRWRALPCGEDAADAVDVVNSTGNAVTAEGYGYDRDFLTVDAGEGVGALEEVFGFCGAAAALRTTALDAVGGFDTRYFLYYEDTDLSWRLRLRGWRVVYAHDARARHRHQGSVGTGSALHAFYDDRNRLLTLAKDAPATCAVTAWVRHPVATLSLGLRGTARTGQVRLRGRAFTSALRLLPRSLALRRVARAGSHHRVRVDRLLRDAPPAAELQHG